ncbi:MAG: site-specific integrase [Planctomycetota bacterium]|nr:site-specific integrase [Planctomycetota bacterium]
MATVRKRNGKWQVQVRRHGSAPATRTFRSKSDALAWGHLQEARIDRGEALDAPKRLRRLIVGDLLGKYLVAVTPTKKSSDKEVYRIKRLQNHRLSSIPLSELGSHHIAEFRDQRLTQVGSQSARHDLNLLGHVFTVAVRDWGIPLERNPVREIRLPKLSSPRERRLTPGEAKTIVSMADSELRCLIEFALETAMRKTELLSATWADYNHDKYVLEVPVTKNGHCRFVPLSKKAVECLERRLPTTERRSIFSLSAAAIRYRWTRLTKRAGIEDLHFHDLRHEAISRLFEKGLSVAEVALISGHRDVRQLFRYTHLRAEDIAKKLQ